MLKAHVVVKLLALTLVSCASVGTPLVSLALPAQLSTELFPLTEWNFGVVKNNSTYQIYRSEILGTQGLNAIVSHLKKSNLPLPKTIVYMNINGYSDKDLRAFEEFQAQQAMGFEFFHSFRYDYRTYLDGGDPSSPAEDIDDGKYLGTIAKETFGVIVDSAHDGDEAAFKRILNVVLDPSRQPVLFHCLGGRHRTGMVAMALRYIEGGAWLEGTYSVRVPPFFQKRDLNRAQYEYQQHNSVQFRDINLRFIEKFFSNGGEGSEYIGKYRNQLLAQ
jgi:hypothetical protein